VEIFPEAFDKSLDDLARHAYSLFLSHRHPTCPCLQLSQCPQNSLKNRYLEISIGAALKGSGEVLVEDFEKIVAPKKVIKLTLVLIIFKNLP
jgi:hypothetical protein